MSRIVTMLRLAAPLAAVLTIGALAACGDNKLGPNVAASVVRSAGDSQTVLAGNHMSAPLVAQILNSGGSPLPNTPVRWAVSSGGGSLAAVEDTTDANGKVSNTFFSPTKVATAKVTASASDQSATFSMIIVPDTVASITAVVGDGSAGLVGSSLTLIARAADRFGNVIKGVTVNWSSPNGTLQQPTSVTDSLGKASNVVTLGQSPGTVSVLASSPFNSITFNVSALPTP